MTILWSSPRFTLGNENGDRVAQDKSEEECIKTTTENAQDENGKCAQREWGMRKARMGKKDGWRDEGGWEGVALEFE